MPPVAEGGQGRDRVASEVAQIGQALRPGRLRRRAEFLEVAARGRKAAMPGVVVQALKVPEQEGVRLGFTCSRKVGNAVARNRARRRLREAARRVLPPALSGWTLVLVGRPATVDRPFDALSADLAASFRKLGLA